VQNTGDGLGGKKAMNPVNKPKNKGGTIGTLKNATS
jgi:hypothetical protein